jgi:ribose transport system permease protein
MIALTMPEIQSKKIKNFRIHGWLNSPVTFSFIALILFIILSGIIQPGYLASSHILTVIQQSAPLIIVTIGQTYVIMSGGIDLSGGAIVIFTDVFCAQIMLGNNSNFALAIGLSLLVGAIFGLVNGLGIEFLKLPPLIMTLATSLGIKGLMLLFCGGFPKGGASPLLKMIGSGKIFGLPASILVWGGALLIAVFLLKKTKFGWNVSLIGANRRAARAMGINTSTITILVYVLSGFFSALAGLLVLGFVGIPSLTLGDDYTMASIAATVLGGTSFTGGIGSAFGALSGALIMRFMLTLLTAFNISAAGKDIVQGFIILIVVVLLILREKNNFLKFKGNFEIFRRKILSKVK